MKRDRKAELDLEALPGHHIRRLQQIAVGIFMDEAADLNAARNIRAKAPVIAPQVLAA